jgi:hypothetical protein
MLYASMLGVEIQDAKMHVAGTWKVEGSVYRQTRKAVMERVETSLEVRSDDDPARVAAVLRNASNGCYAEQAIRNPVPIDETVSLNGAAFVVDDYPAEAVQRP